MFYLKRANKAVDPKNQINETKANFVKLNDSKDDFSSVHRLPKGLDKCNDYANLLPTFSFLRNIK